MVWRHRKWRHSVASEIYGLVQSGERQRERERHGTSIEVSILLYYILSVSEIYLCRMCANESLMLFGKWFYTKEAFSACTQLLLHVCIVILNTSF